MKILHTSDLHIAERLRLDDTRRMLDAIVGVMAERGVGLLIVAGDHFDRKSTPAERMVLADFFRAACELAPVVSVRGNHDAPGDLDIFRRLQTNFPLVISDRPETVHCGQVVVQTLPWVEKVHLAAAVDVTENASAMTVEALRALLATFRAEALRVREAGKTPVLATHVMIGGSVVSSGQCLIGCPIELSPADLGDLGFEYVAAGHVHRHQQFYGGRVAYSGSPIRCDFSEVEPKGACLVTFDDDGAFLSNEFVELPARRMIRIEGRIDGPVDANTFGLSAHGDLSREDLNGALVRLRYHVSAENLHLVDAEALKAALLADGAAEVQLEAVVVSETRARAPEIATARSTWEKVVTWLDSKGLLHGTALTAAGGADRLKAKLAELEAR